MASRPASIAIAAFCLAVPLAGARAQSPIYTGYGLYLECNVAVQSGLGVEAASCTEYLTGMLEGILTAAAKTKVATPICGYEKATPLDLPRVYVSWARTHTDRLTEPRWITAYAAFASAYPCPGGKP
jgi:Rap1a immunity proteins